MNLYGFVGNDGVGAVDVLGLDSEKNWAWHVVNFITQGNLNYIENKPDLAALAVARNADGILAAERERHRRVKLATEAIQTGADIYDALAIGASVAAGFKLGDWLLQPNRLDDLPEWLQQILGNRYGSKKSLFCPISQIDPLLPHLQSESAFAFDMINNPGPLSLMRDNPASNFSSGKYNAIHLADDLVLYRVGDAKTELGQWFARNPATSIAQTRIDLAVKAHWIDQNGTLTGSSPLNTSYAIKIPKGTIIYEGPVGYQGGVYLGGQEIHQIFVPQPWKIPGVQVVDRTVLR